MASPTPSPSSSAAPSRARKASSWRSVRMPSGPGVAHSLQQRYRLRWHGLLIGSFTLVLMWCTSHLQMLLGVDTLALRYLVTLSVGYVGYLLVLRAWAARLLREDGAGGGDAGDAGDAALDLADLAWDGSTRGPGSAVDAGDGSASALGDLAGGVGEALGSADEGAVVVVPVVAIFLIGAAVILGAGSLAMLFFGWDVLLTVAVELAFSVATARAAVRVEREGWLTAAVRLTWKPLLGALACAVALGATLDHFLPDVQSLPEAVRAIQGR